MSNRFKIRRGNSAPSPADLELYELGYAINDNQLYIKSFKNNVEEVKAIGGKINIKYDLEVVAGADSYSLGTSRNPLPVESNSVVLVDLDYNKLKEVIEGKESTVDHIIRIYRTFDFIDDGITTGIINLKVNGSAATANDIQSIRGAFDNTNTAKIPLKIVVIN